MSEEQPVQAWCAERSWIPRVPLLLWCAYMLVHYWGNPNYTSLFGGINLGIHEIGHIVFAPLGMFMGIAGGSLLQCLAPVFSVFVFARQRDYFAMAFCAAWLSVNLFEVARYMGDARALELNLVSPFGGDPMHDWRYLLESQDMLMWDTTLATATRAVAVAFMLLFFASALRLLTWMRAVPTS